MASVFLGLVFLTAACFPQVVSFMPNYVFSFRPPNQPTPPPSSGPSLPGVEIAAGFLPDDFYPIAEDEGPLHDDSWTHKDIIRRACLNVVARFYEETTASLAKGSVTGLSLLTPATLLRAVFGPDTSSSNFERAIEEIEIAAAKMDLWYEVNATLDRTENIARVHFDDEQFRLGQSYLLQLRRQMFAAVQKGALSAARDLAGRFMLTLQDFYAHSNYVELDNDDILKDLGKPGSADFLKNVAGSGEVVCSDCFRPLGGENSCPTNTDPSIDLGKLTSGYLFYPMDNINTRVKPSGKCSHGDAFDQSRERPAIGGINKSTKNHRKSPHYFLHEDAAQLAIKATEHFLQGIRDVVSDETFLQIFNLGVSIGGSSLVFVIDQSGSMRDDIAAAIDRATAIVQSSSQPFDYVLVQFNDYDKDPAFGPPFVTHNSTAFIEELNKLTPDGGGDCPELAMHGIHLGLTRSLPGSSLYVFTDAGAKDCDLNTTVFSWIDGTGSTVNFFFTGDGTPCGSCPDEFDEVARKSGGQLLDITKSDVDKASRLAQSSAEASQVVLLSVSSPDSSGNYHFIVDCTVRKLTVSLSGQTPTVSMAQPDGTIYRPVNELLLDKFLLFNISNPMKSIWYLNATFAGKHSVVVQAVSSIGFDYKYVFVGGRPGHLGVFPISGQPIANTLAKTVITVDGLEDTNVTEGFTVDLIDSTGTLIETLEPEQGSGYSTNLFGLAFLSPKTPFRLRLQGTDKCGGHFTRISPTETTSQTIGFSSDPTDVDNALTPGGFTNATFTLHNSGSSDDFTILYRDEQGFGESIDVQMIDFVGGDLTGSRRRRRATSDLEMTIRLEANESARVTVRYGAPKSAAFGQSNTATLTASTGTGSTFNYVSFQMIVTPEDQDETPPSCAILDYNACDKVTALECNRYLRTVKAQFRDTGIGLQTIRARQRGVQLAYNFESGTNKTVNVTATSNCCYLSIDFESSDVVGNLQSDGCSAVIPPGVPNDRITLVGILVPDGSTKASGIVRVVVEDWKTLHYSVNITGIVPSTFRLYESRSDGRIGDILFTVAGFNYGDVLSGSLPVDGSYLPIIYGGTAYGAVQYSSDGNEMSIGGQILYSRQPDKPSYEALLACDKGTNCKAAGYVALTLRNSPTKGDYYLLVGGQNVSEAIITDGNGVITDGSGGVIIRMKGGKLGSYPGEGIFSLSSLESNKLAENLLSAVVTTSEGIALRGVLRKPWEPTVPPVTTTQMATTASGRAVKPSFFLCCFALLLAVCHAAAKTHF
eukprot:m.3463 g.3463  ORF g.3463 m.3463 type:complete len:1268 (+) comp9407_c0_seq1:67-3870(+)